MKNLVIALRSAIFHIAVFLFTVVYSAVSIWFLAFLPFETRFRYITIYSHAVLFLAKTICGIKYQVEGAENIGKYKVFVILSNHQSQWEAFFFANLVHPLIIVCKKELLKLPLAVGWGIGLMRPITIDRSNPKQALKDISSQGKQRLLEDKLPVLMFPEGTRMKVGSKVKYARSGAALAIAAGVPVIFVSHNAGYFWPTGRLMKFPGTVTVRISEPVDPSGLTAQQLTDQAQEWIESNFQKL
jgi:1-acyl-sn-glycerol-3-phosphate acyltransferase